MLFSSLISLLPLAAASPLSTRENWGKGGSNSALRSVASPRNRYIGTAYQSFYLDDPRFEPVLNREFDQYTAENEMKWEVIQPQRGVFNFTGADLIMAQANKTGSIVRQHTLVWHSQLPSWVQNITDPEDLKYVMKNHIGTVLGRYPNQFAHIDVVNEPVLDNGTYRDSVFYNLLGKDFIRLAFEYADAMAPKSKLYINDYNIESINNKSRVHAEIVRSLQASNTRIDGVGFQSHFIGGSVPGDMAQCMKMFTDMGVEVAVTELDVRVPVNNRGLTNSTWIEQQASDYAEVTQVCLNNTKCPGITIWGVSDETSWVPGVFAGEGAAMLFDFDYKPKPAYSAVYDAFRG